MESDKHTSQPSLRTARLLGIQGLSRVDAPTTVLGRMCRTSGSGILTGLMSSITHTASHTTLTPAPPQPGPDTPRVPGQNFAATRLPLWAWFRRQHVPAGGFASARISLISFGLMVSSAFTACGSIITHTRQHPHHDLLHPMLAMAGPPHLGEHGHGLGQVRLHVILLCLALVRLHLCGGCVLSDLSTRGLHACGRQATSIRPVRGNAPPTSTSACIGWVGTTNESAPCAHSAYVCVVWL